MILLKINITFQLNGTSVQKTYIEYLCLEIKGIKFRSQEVQNLVEEQTTKQTVTIQCRKYRLLQ